MKVIEPNFEIIYCYPHLIKFLEEVGRTCYRSEDLITPESSEKFIKMLVDRDHTAMLEHGLLSVKFLVNRGASHEMVRHRIASFSQESTRYVGYHKDKFGGELTLIRPYWFDQPDTEDLQTEWYDLMGRIENLYMKAIKNGNLQPQAIRGVLPNDLATTLVVSANPREWRTILKLRTSIAAHPDMRRVMIPLLDRFVDMYPVLFQDIRNELNSNNK